MDPIRWTDKSLDFRTLIESPTIKKPVLTLYGERSAIVGIKICGEFITACPCRITRNQIVQEQEEIVLSSKFQGIWRVLSKGTSRNEYRIPRLTTKEIEKIHLRDIENERATPRTYVCTREIEAFDLLIHQNDPTVYEGIRSDRRRKRIEESVEFEIEDIGEVEYTPPEAERTTQDYVFSKQKSRTFLPFRMAVTNYTEPLVRNRVLRALSCTTSSESQRHHFLLEINDDPCDIRPIASDGSIELRYLHSTQNLYNYMSHYGNDVFLCVRLVRGEMPVKAADFDGCMIFTSTFVGDRVPMCHVHNQVLSFVSPDVPVKVKLPVDESKWRSLPEVHAAERQCMGLSLALLSRYESESFVNVEKSPNTIFHVPANSDSKAQPVLSRIQPSTIERHIEKSDKTIRSPPLMLSSTKSTHTTPLRSTKTTVEEEERTSLHSSTLKVSKPISLAHFSSDLLYRDHESERRSVPDDAKHERRQTRSTEKSSQIQSKNNQNLSSSQPSVFVPHSILKNKNRR